MSRPLLALLLALALVTAGCLGGGDDAETAADASETGATGGDGPPDEADDRAEDAWNATLDEAPPWKVGEWWEAQVTDAVTDETHTVTFVVAEDRPGGYALGAAADDFSDAVVVAHWPPLGIVAQDLAWSMHNAEFDPVEFPVEEGRTWDTSYLGQDGYTAEVVSVDGLAAEIEVSQSPGSSNVSLTYDARTKMVTSIQGPLGVEFEVTDHGTGHEGDVVVPEDRAQYVSARVVGAFDLSGPIFGLGPAPLPTESVDVSEPQASAALLAGSVDLAGTPPPGYYQEVVHTPGDDSHSLQTTGTSGIEAMYVHVDEAQGTWDFEHVAGGVGVAGTEIIAYDQVTYTLDGDATAS